jgi:tetrahydromethanopterin S-methyltransferase subunit D
MKPMASNKCLIILTPSSCQQVQGISPIDHKFQFEHLSKESQEIFIARKVDFQGHKLTVKSILHEHGIVGHALGSLGADMFSGFVTKGTVQLGGRLHTNSD